MNITFHRVGLNLWLGKMFCFLHLLQLSDRNNNGKCQTFSSPTRLSLDTFVSDLLLISIAFGFIPSTSSTVSGSLIPLVSGNSKEIPAAARARPPNTRKGSSLNV